eukprot:COSAG01_NODE_24209_length_786_cov_2.455604_2_plen_117_part_01
MSEAFTIGLAVACDVGFQKGGRGERGQLFVSQLFVTGAEEFVELVTEVFGVAQIFSVIFSLCDTIVLLCHRARPRRPLGPMQDGSGTGAPEPRALTAAETLRRQLQPLPPHPDRPMQ